MVKFSANLGFLWPDRPLPERIDAAAAAGFRAVELHYPYAVPAAEIRDRCHHLGVTLLGINTNIDTAPDGHRGLGAVPGREADFAALMDEAIAWANAAGAVSIHAMAGLVAETQRDIGHRTLVENLKAAAPAAAARGLDLVLEPLSPRATPGYFYSRIEEAIAVLDEVGAANVKLMFDVFHVGSAEGDVLMKLRAHFDRIGHVQIASVPDRTEPDEGEIAYKAIFAELDRLGYDGWVGAEYTPRGDTDQGLRWTKALGVTL